MQSYSEPSSYPGAQPGPSSDEFSPHMAGQGLPGFGGRRTVGGTLVSDTYLPPGFPSSRREAEEFYYNRNKEMEGAVRGLGPGQTGFGAAAQGSAYSVQYLSEGLLNQWLLQRSPMSTFSQFDQDPYPSHYATGSPQIRQQAFQPLVGPSQAQLQLQHQAAASQPKYPPRQYLPQHFQPSATASSASYPSPHTYHQLYHSGAQCDPNPLTGPAYPSGYSYQPPAPKPCYDQGKGSLGSPGLRYAPPAKLALLGSQMATFCSAETPGKSPLHFHPAFSPGSNPSPTASRAQSPCCSSSPSPLLPGGEGLPCGLGRTRLLGSMPRSSPTLAGQYAGDRRASDSLTALSSQVANITPGLPTLPTLLGPHRRTVRRPTKDNVLLAPDPGPLAERPGLSPSSERAFPGQATERLPGLPSSSSPSNQEPIGRLCHDGPLGRAPDLGHRTFGARGGEGSLGLGLGGYPIIGDKDTCLPQQTSPSFTPKIRSVTHNGGCTLPQAPRLLTSPLTRPVDLVKPPNFLNYSFPNCGPQPRPPNDSPGHPTSGPLPSGPLPSGPHSPSPHPSGPYPTSSYTQPRPDLRPKAAHTSSLLQAALQAGFPARKPRCSYIPEPQYSRDCPLEFSGQDPGREDANGASLPEVPDWLLNDHGAAQVDSDPQAGPERKSVICDISPAPRVTPQGPEPGYQLLSPRETRPGECARPGPSECAVAGECARMGFGESERAVASEGMSTGRGGCLSEGFVGDRNLSASLEAEAKGSTGSPNHPRFDSLELKTCSKMASTSLHAGLVGDFSQHAPRSRGTRARRAGGRPAARRRAASRSRGSENPDTFSQFNPTHLTGLHRVDRGISGPCQRPVSSETLALMLSTQPNVQPSCVQNEGGARTQVWEKSPHQWNRTVESEMASGGPGRNLGVESEANGWTSSKPVWGGDLGSQETERCSLTADPQQAIDDLSPPAITGGATGVMWNEGPRSAGLEEPLLPPLIISRRRIRPFISPIPSKRQCPEQTYTQTNPSPFPTPEDAHREMDEKTSPDGDLSPTSPLAKALPPRKGRGSKLEAIVQKISSPNGRKFPLTGVGDGSSEGVTLDDILLAKEIMWPGEDVCKEHGFLGDNTVQKGKHHQRSHQNELLASSQAPASPSLSSLTRWASQSQHPPLSLVPLSPNTESSGRHNPDKCSGKGYFPSGKKRGRPLGSINKPKRQQEGMAEGEDLEEMSQSKKPGKKTYPRPRTRRKTLPLNPIVTPGEPDIEQKAPQVAPRSQRRMFSPYVRLEQKSPERVLCSIFNTEEEEGRGRVTILASGPANKSFPTSSHVVLGPLVTEASTLGPLVCSLCGKFPNHRNLGDLFGPYYPQEYASTLPRNPPARRALPPQARVKVRHKSMPELVRPTLPGESREAEGLIGPHRLRRRHHSEEGGPTWVSPRAANPGQKPRYQWCELRTQNPKAEPLSQVELDLPHLPLDPNELWLHGPCVVWASGVYLLNGHLYGLQEAMHMAREMKCSHCQEFGATLGCYCKGCSLRYHYVCAVQAGCLMNEENLSINCPKHKHRALKVIITDQSERG